MENRSQSGLRQGLYEYLLIASPDKAVAERVMEEKRRFYEDYQHEVAIKTHPHITVSVFLAKNEMEDTLVRWLQRIIGEQRSFPVTLNNYSGFPPHTVFLRIQDPSPFKRLVMQLQPIDSYVKSNACPPVKFITCPHMSIARKLPSIVYERAISDYAHRMFHDSFAVTELTLLRRQHQYDACKQVAVFRLQPNDNYTYSGNKNNSYAN